MSVKPEKQLRRLGRTIAVLEVVVAFGVMHVAFRVFKRYTTPGQLENEYAMNFSPGLAMILVGLSCLLLRRRRPREYGVTLHPWWQSVNMLLVFLAMFVVFGTIAYGIGINSKRNTMGVSDVLAIAGLNLMVTGILLWILRRYGEFVERLPRWVGIATLALVLLLSMYPVVARNRPVVQQGFHILWIVIGSAIGEEFFFRGYVQSRLNEAFGHPFQLFGVKFGVGLIVAALLFGLIHVLNPTDYLAGVYRFNWGHGLTTATTLYFGFLREKTGGIAAPALIHGCTNLLGLALR